ncbi:MAG TPA: 50S ribosomal protein L20 [Oligoflexia bacterium]|nr:50S ribosomal protein L20 [Oligoflexia bacterium]HMP26641.1 50S ribosomal protein L20 [Oligoflexia bacterium]
MRVKGGIKGRKRHKRWLKKAEGFRGRRKNCFRLAKLAVQRSMRYAYKHRRLRKRQFRELWILRINAAARSNGLSYSKFMANLKTSGISLNRKVLADLATRNPTTFAALCSKINIAN